MARAPACVEFTAKVDQSPDGPVIAAIATVFASTDAEAQQTCASLGQDAPDGALAFIGPMPTPVRSLYDLTGASTPAGSRYGVDCFWSEAKFEPALERIVHGISEAPSAQSFGLLALRSNARSLPDVCAFSVTGRLFGTIYGVWNDQEADAANMTWLRGLAEGFNDLATGRYVGEADLDRTTHDLRTLSDAAGLRLAELRARYDPAGLFPTRARQCAGASGMMRR